nr:DoxX family protein [Mesorhizobium sp. B1-1-1]
MLEILHFRTSIVFYKENSWFIFSVFITLRRHSKFRIWDLPIGEREVSETMNPRQAAETVTLHRALWAGRIMSALVVIALVADGTIQLLAPAQIASMLQETGFTMDLTRVVGPIILACAILYAIPATAVLGAILVTGFLGGAICAHVRIGELGSPPEIISLFLGALAWGGLYLRDPRVRAILPLIH